MSATKEKGVRLRGVLRVTGHSRELEEGVEGREVGPECPCKNYTGSSATS